MVTKRTLEKNAWTLPKTNITLDWSDIYTRAQAVIVAISREQGVDLV